MPRIVKPLATCLLLLVFLGTSCSRFLPTKIGDIQKDPRKYDGETVTIEGEVQDSVNIMVMRYYTVSDGTGEIFVMTDGAVPAEGSQVRVTGTVSQAMSMGDKSLLVLIEKTE